MLPFADRPLVQHIWSRARYTGYPVFLATSDQREDDLLASLAEADDIPVFRGSLDDVLGRAAAAAEHWQLEGFARLCGDRPFFCIESMKRALEVLAAKLDDNHSNVSIVSNTMPRAPASGLATEALSTAALLLAARECRDQYHREHVTPMFYNGFHCLRAIALADPSEYYTAPGMAVDTLQDYRRLSLCYRKDPKSNLPTPEAISNFRRLVERP